MVRGWTVANVMGFAVLHVVGALTLFAGIAAVPQGAEVTAVGIIMIVGGAVMVAAALRDGRRHLPPPTAPGSWGAARVLATVGLTLSAAAVVAGLLVGAALT